MRVLYGSENRATDHGITFILGVFKESRETYEKDEQGFQKYPFILRHNSASCSELARPPPCGPTRWEHLSFRCYGSKAPDPDSGGADIWVLPEKGPLKTRFGVPWGSHRIPERKSSFTLIQEDCKYRGVRMASLGRKWDAYRTFLNRDYVTLSGKTWKGFIFWSKRETIGHLRSLPTPRCGLV